MRRYRAELLTAAALLAGWLLITWWVAMLTSWRVWPFSLGLLLVSCGGWRLLYAVARDGLYALTRGPNG